MKAREAIKKLRKQGWYIYKHGTRHDLWTHDKLRTRKFVEVPRHYSTELSKGVEIDIKNAMQEVEENIKEEDKND